MLQLYQVFDSRQNGVEDVQLSRVFAVNSIGVEFVVTIDGGVNVDDDVLYRIFFDTVNEGAFLGDTTLRLDLGNVNDSYIFSSISYYNKDIVFKICTCFCQY